MSDSNTTGVLDKLKEFLSTDIRKKLFFFYVFSKSSPSEIAEVSKTPISTVDMVTNTLRLMELLKEAKGKETKKNYYEINMDIWLSENLKNLNMGFIKDEQKKEMLGIMGDKKFLALSLILTDPDFATNLYSEPLKMGDDLIVFKLMRLFKAASLVSHLPSYILMSVLVFPSFKKLKDNLFSEEGLEETLKLIKAEATKKPFLAAALKDVDLKSLKEYDEKRAALSRIMELLIEQELQLLSTEKAKKKLEFDLEKEEKPKEKEIPAEEEKEEEEPEKAESKKEEKKAKKSKSEESKKAKEKTKKEKSKKKEIKEEEAKEPAKEGSKDESKEEKPEDK